MSKKHQFFENQECEFYPCHLDMDKINCLFCYCPLYTTDCGGDYNNIAGIKDCSQCTLPHQIGGYEFILEGLTKTDYSLHH